MSQIFPKLLDYSHVVSSEEATAKSQYPKNYNSLKTIVNILLKKDQKLIVLNELIGAGNEWCQAKLVDSKEYGDIEIYVNKNDIKSVEQKIFMSPSTSSDTNLAINYSEIEWTTKEEYIPFVDRKNGNLCVVINSEYENILSVQHLEIMAKKAYLEGIQLLLKSKGFSVSEDSIKENLKKYYSFGKVQEFFVDTRSCMPVKLLVCFPLRFLNKENLSKEPKKQILDNAEYEIKINSRSFEYKIDRLLSAFNYFSNDIDDFLSPNGVITSYIREYEILMIKRFVSTTLSMFLDAEMPINSLESTDYVIGLDKDLKIIYAYKEEGDGKLAVEDSIINSYRFRSPYDTKRTLYYFIVIDSIIREFSSLELKPFFNKYVKYPTPEFKEIDINIDGRVISNARAKEVKDTLKASAKQCQVFSGAKFLDNINSISEDFRNIQNISADRTLSATQRSLDSDREELSLGDSAWSAFKRASGASSFNAKDSGWKQVFKVIRTLSGIANKMNLAQWAIEYLICILKKTDSENALELLTQLGPDVIQMLNYAIIIAESERELNFNDAEILLSYINLNACTESEQDNLLMVLKVLSAVTTTVKGVKDGMNSVLKFITTPPQNTTNLMKNITNSVVTTVFNLLIDILKQLLQNALEDACADDPNNIPLGQSGARNPFNSSGLSRPDGGGLVPNQQNLKNDRAAALKDAGILGDKDPEQYLDLIKMLLDDITCVLTPQEICSILIGEPEQETITLVKTIIRKKYLPELNELLEELKLRVFFKELGKRIDKNICEEISRIPVTNPNIPSLFCSPQQLAARKKLLEDKMPEELLNQQLSNYNKRKVDQAKTALDLLKNNMSKTLDVPYFCGNGEEGLVSPLNEWARKSAKQQIDSLFSPLYTRFNSESSEWSDSIIYKRKEKEDGTVKEIYEPSYNLRKNLEDDSSFRINGANYSLVAKNKLVDQALIDQIKQIDAESFGGQEQKDQIINNITSVIDKEYAYIDYDGTKIQIYVPNTNERIDLPFSNDLDLDKKIDNLESVFKKNLEQISKNYEDAVVGYGAFASLLASLSSNYDLGMREKQTAEIPVNSSISKQQIKQLLIDNLDKNKAFRTVVSTGKYFQKDMSKSTIKYLNVNDDPEDQQILNYKRRRQNWNIPVIGDTGIRKVGPWKLVSFIDGPPLIKGFKISRDPSQKEIDCGVDTHYLNINNIKKKILSDYEDKICEEKTGPQDGGRKEPNAFERANLEQAIILIVRILLADYLLRSLPILSKIDIKKALEDKFFASFYKSQIINELKAYDLDLYNRFDKYIKQVYDYNKENNKLDNRFLDSDPYIYLLKKELYYASNKFKRSMEQYALKEGGSISSLFQTKDFESNINGEKIYIEESIQLRERKIEDPETAIIAIDVTIGVLFASIFIGNPFAIFTPFLFAYEGALRRNRNKREVLNIPYAAFDSGNTASYFNFKFNTGVYACSRLVSIVDNKKVILAENLKDTGYDFNQFFQREPREVEQLRQDSTEELLRNEIFSVAGDFLFSDAAFAKLLIPYSYYTNKLTPQETNAYAGSKGLILSIFDILTSEKDYSNVNSVQDTSEIDSVLQSLASTKFPSDVLAQNPGLNKFNAKFLVQTILRTPIDMVLGYTEQSDPNVALSKITSDGIQLAANIAWIFVDEEEKQKLYRQSPYPYKFLRDGQRVAPVFILSPIYMLALVFPFNPITYGVYMTVSIFDFLVYTAKLAGEKLPPIETLDQGSPEYKQISEEPASCSDTDRQKLELIAEGEL